MAPRNGKNATFGPPVDDPAAAGRPYVRVRPIAHVTRPVGAFSFTRERYRGVAMDEHTHACWQLVVPLSGRAHLKVGAEAFMIGPEVGVLVARALADARREERALDPRVLQALDRMTRGFDPELTIAGLAAEVHLTPRHFERLFKRALGRTPREHLLEVRLARARRLLEGTERPVADVAAEVGFYDASHLIAAFRRAFEATPAAYRRMQRGGGR